MNKTKTIILATLGGIDTVVYLFTPIFIGLIWIYIFNRTWVDNFIIGICLLSSVFRGIKIGWLKE